MSILNEGELSKNLDEIHYKRVNNLSGKIMFFNMLGKLENGWAYSKGMITMRINGSLEGYYFGFKPTLGDLKNPAITRTGSRFNKLMTYSPEPCAFPQPDWRTSCVGVDGYMECTTYLAGYFCVDQTPNGGGEGGYNPYGGNPGHGGGGGSNDPQNTPPNDITNQFNDYPCAKALVENMKTLNGDIATLIKNRFAQSDLMDISFIPDSSLRGTSTDGKLAQVARAQGSATYTIGINPDVLSKATKEYILVTLYHEALHAFFIEKLHVLGQAEFDRQYLGVTVNGGRMLGVPNDAHIPMGYNRYVMGLKNAILAFNSSYNPDRATALAEFGIIQLIPSDVNVNKQERNPDDPNYPGATGTRCPK